MHIQFRKYFILTIISCCFAYHGNTQEALQIPAAFKSIGNASVSIQSPVAVFSNPAGAVTQKFTAGSLYEKRFLLKELSTRSVFIILPHQKNYFLYSFSQFGNEGYRENRLSVGLAKKLTSILSAGIQFHYFSLYLAENDRRPGNLVADLGVQIQMSDCGFGVQYFNPYAVSVNENSVDIKYPCVLRLGANKKFQDTFLLAAEVNMENHEPVNPRLGMQYQMKKQLTVRCGVETQNGILSLGLGYSFKMICTDIAFSWHQYLGLSPSVNIYYQRQ